MKNFTLRETEQAISKTQVWLQLGSSFVFAAGMFAPFCAKPLSPAWLWCYFTAVTVGVVSLGVLVRTLIQICDLQLRHELLEHENHISTN